MFRKGAKELYIREQSLILFFGLTQWHKKYRCEAVLALSALTYLQIARVCSLMYNSVGGVQNQHRKNFKIGSETKRYHVFVLLS